MQTNRRNFLIGTAAVAGVGAAAGYRDALGAALSMSDQGTRNADPIYGKAAEPEIRIGEDGEPQFNSRYRLVSSVCNGCTTHCGIRLKIDRESGEILRVSGNPYNLLSSDPWLDYETPLSESYRQTAAASGHTFRSTACARGNVIFDKLKDPFRVTRPLKRVGTRGEDRWVEISPEQLLQEITEGGDLFGEGHVDGLREICDYETPLDPKYPEKGPKSNQLAIFGTGDDGRKAYMVHRFMQSFGTPNYFGHTAICGLSMRAGEAAFLGDYGGSPHLKPDFEECEFLLTIGTSPAQAGNPFKRQAQLLARARSDKRLHYAVVTPMLTNADTVASGNRSRWLPVKPGEDLALMMAMMRWIIDNDRHNKAYLQIPSPEAMQAAGEPSYTNASHLVQVEGEAQGEFLRDGDQPLVVDDADGQLRPASQVRRARLIVDDVYEWQGSEYRLRSSFDLLREATREYSLEEYSKFCGVPVRQIVHVAREFTSHGRKVAVDCHGGTMHTTGFYTAYAIVMLGGLVGNLNYRGGMSAGGGKFKDFNGVRYQMVGYPGKRKPKGYRIDRARVAYEKIWEYREKVAAGKNPYPATDTWYPFARALESEVIVSSIKSYPYKLKALLSWNANFMYGQSGSEYLVDKLKDPEQSIPLIIAIDPFINESSRFADYIVPDAVLYETWGSLRPWNGYLTKANIFRYPVIDSPNARFANGEPISMDSFVIELGKKLGLPGFGEKAIKDKSGGMHALDRPEDFYLRVFENVAMDGTAVPDIGDDEIALAGIEHLMPSVKRVCGDNWRKVAYAMARGGRFAAKHTAYSGDVLNQAYTKKPVNIYNQILGTSFNSISGERFSGVPRYYPQRLNDGTLLSSSADGGEFPLRAFSYKSAVLSQAVAASDAITDLRYSTYVDLNPATAGQLGLQHGDLVEVESRDGSIRGLLRYRHGVHPEAIAIEHGAGREGEGALDVQIDDRVIQGRINRKSGININKLGLNDSSRQGISTLADFVVGSNARQAIPVRIRKAV